jgi:hypothetical protein
MFFSYTVKKNDLNFEGMSNFHFSFDKRDLKPIIVEPWDMRDEDDGLPERTLIRNDVFFK